MLYRIDPEKAKKSMDESFRSYDMSPSKMSRTEKANFGFALAMPVLGAAYAIWHPVSRELGGSSGLLLAEVAISIGLGLILGFGIYMSCRDAFSGSQSLSRSVRSNKTVSIDNGWLTVVENVIVSRIHLGEATVSVSPKGAVLVSGAWGRGKIRNDSRVHDPCTKAQMMLGTPNEMLMATQWTEAFPDVYTGDIRSEIMQYAGRG